MGIRFFCPHCDRRLHVKDYLAGRRGICPHCDEPIVIPDAAAEAARGGSESGRPISSAESGHPTSADRATSLSAISAVSPRAEGLDESEFEESEGAADSGVAIELQATSDAEDPLDAAPHLHWCVRPVAGGQYGAKGSIFKTWLQEGRITADDHVWQEGWDQWRLAGEVFPSLSASGAIVERSERASSQGAAAKPVSVSSSGSGSLVASKDGTQGAAERGNESRVDERVTKLDRTRERLLDYRLNRTRSRGREWVAVLVLGLVCVALVSALVWLILQRR